MRNARLEEAQAGIKIVGNINNLCALLQGIFLTCIQISQEAGQVVWYSHLLKNFPQFVVITQSKALHSQ